MRNAPAQGGYAGLAGLIGDLANAIRRTQAERTKLDAVLAARNDGLQEGRQQAQQIAGEMMRQAEAVSVAALQVTATDLQIVSSAESAGQSLQTTENAVARALDGIATIAASVRSTTSGAQQMTAAAVQMAEVAHSTHACIASLDDHTAKMVVALDVIEQSLQAAASLGHAANIEATAQGASAPAFARLASELQDVAGICQPALAEVGTALRELVAQTTEANRRTMEIAELVGANHDIGRAVGHAVEQQGQEIARILTELYEARPGFATLRAGVEAVTLACTRTDATDRLKKTANALPSQAEKLATVLRGLPDLTPPIDR